jgi:DHA1 family tetracycline resistance protein-like MFS transporter
MPLVVCIFLINIAAHAVQSTWSYFTMEKFQWNERMVGYSLGVIGILLTIVQAGLIRVIIPKLGLAKSIVTGLFLNCISLFAFGIVDTTLLLFVTSIFYVFAGIAGPAMQSSISNHTPANEQGQIQGGLTSIISLTAIIGPLVMTSLFSFFTKKNGPMYLPGAPFYLGSLLALISVIIAINYFRQNNQ